MNTADYAAYLLAEHGNRLYRLARSLTGDDNAANDLCQEVWCNVLASKQQSRPDDAGEFPWLCCIIKNAWVTGYRKKKARIDVAVGDGFEGSQQRTSETLPDARLEKKEQIGAMNDCVQELPMEFREVLQLRYGCDLLSYEEISDMLGIPKGTVGSRAGRGKKLVAECMERKGYA